MGDQNRKTFKYGIRRSGQHQADPSRIRSLDDLRGPETKASVGRVDTTFHATAEDIAAYRRELGRQ